MPALCRLSHFGHKPWWKRVKWVDQRRAVWRGKAGVPGPLHALRSVSWVVRATSFNTRLCSLMSLHCQRVLER